ncbi:heavy metal translocating P-type ATPase [Enterocloster citroniae]|uniref:Cd(2+)-exporting ATPase n=2 Tax=Enterocloster citroniae TaxID=358743 RepID=A0ABV2FW88_9FIRM|nr:heavy metal translocating P-type ATPase [Enterocloster citroniae]KMW11324.1 cadmium-translocating P-type ATPase [[Clostridium] citroniae WAL-19142]MCB7064993.1 cadmium-translocating P-type ATPase [Enterocloster citroniae]MCC8084562.1 cadmium-translocating P-type ATPase [Clostridium sp.]
MTKKQKAMLGRILLTFIIYVPMAVADHMDMLPAGLGTWGKLAVYLIPYVLIGWDIVYKALRNIRNGQVFDENFLMTVATFGAFGIGEYSEAVAVMLFYQVGELFQSYAVNRSRQSITELMDICPEYANIEEDGQLKQVDPDDVQVGDIIVVKAGERIPLDGKVVFGDSMVDTSALTGESVPRKASVGDDVISGCVNGSGLLRVQVTKEFDDSTVAKILELVENASSKKAQVENFITRFARYYTPVVVVGAVILAVLPPLVFGQSWAEWVRRACTFLVISCPCALVISVPMSFFSGIGAASRRGVLIKGSNYLEALSEMNTIVFDKTGTLTKGEFKVTEIHAAVGTQESLLELAALAESYSDHPISRSIKEACGHALDMNRVSDTEEISGHGVKAVIDGHVVLAGNSKLMKEMKVEYTESPSIGTAVYIAMDGTFYGSIIISDTIKEEAYEAIRSLKRVGVKRTVMLTGDKKEVGEAVAARLGLDEVHAELLPDGKVAKVEELLAELKGKDKLAFVGDGINDAPVLSRADIGIAMGSMGSDAAIEAADIVLMDDDPSKIADVVRISRKTMTIVKQNIIFALGVKAIVLLMGAFGMANMWEAVFADVGVSVIAIINAMRALSL